MSKTKGIADQLRAAIAKAEKRGVSRYQIARAAGLPHSQFHRVADGENLPRLDTAEKIAKALGLALRLLPN